MVHIIVIEAFLIDVFLSDVSWAYGEVVFSFLFFSFLKPKLVDVPSSFSVTIIGLSLYVSRTIGIFCNLVSSVLIIQSGKFLGFFLGISSLKAMVLNHLNFINHLNTLFLHNFLCRWRSLSKGLLSLCFGISSSICVILRRSVTSSPIAYFLSECRMERGNTMPCERTPFIFIVFIL